MNADMTPYIGGPTLQHNPDALQLLAGTAPAENKQAFQSYDNKWLGTALQSTTSDHAQFDDQNQNRHSSTQLPLGPVINSADSN